MADNGEQGDSIGEAQDEQTFGRIFSMYLLHTFSAFSGVLGSTTVAGAFVFGWSSLTPR